MTDIKVIIRNWVEFHSFEDDCGYPLISPSDVVLDDLRFRLSLAADDSKTIRLKAQERYDAILPCKGKERRLRRREINESK